MFAKALQAFSGNTLTHKYLKEDNKNISNNHKRSEAGRGGIPLRKIEVLCSDDVADSRLRIVGLTVRLPKTSVAT